MPLIPINPKTPEEVAVSTAVLRVLGATSWTLASSANAQARRWVSLCNLSTSEKAYVKQVVADAALTGAVATTSYDFQLAPGDSLIRYDMPAGYEFVVIRGAVSTDKVRAWEELY